MALLLVIFANVVFFCVLKVQLITTIKNVFQDKKGDVVCGMVLCVIIGLLVSRLIALSVGHLDTPLYHAQSIRWIEDYGAVKGLGNIHNRFAYK